MNTHSHLKKYNTYGKLALALVLSGLLASCASSSSKPSVNNPAPKPKQDASPIKPNDPADPKPPGGPVDTTKELDALNLPAPKAGSFLQENFEHNPDDAPIVRLLDGKLYYDAYKKGTAKKPFFTGFRKAFYSKDGKLTAISMGDNSYITNLPKGNTLNFRWSDQLKKGTNDNLKHIKLPLTKEEIDKKIANNKRPFLDVGLIEGGEKAGVYTDHDDIQGATYVWRDPAVAGWNYQTFGSMKNQNKGVKSGEAYQSIGVTTTKAQLPIEGKATYKGYSMGVYQERNADKTLKVAKDVVADVKVDVNFGKREIKFATFNTKTYEHKGAGKLGGGKSAQQLNLKATANFNKGSAKFSTTKVEVFADDDLKGRLDGRFYGDKAAEVGGTFGLDGNGKNYIGGFGAKRK